MLCGKRCVVNFIATCYNKSYRQHQFERSASMKNLSIPVGIASYGKTGQLLRVSGAAVPFRTVRSTAMLARSATGEVNTVIYLYPAC